MESYLYKKLPILEINRIKANIESPKRILLNPEKFKEIPLSITSNLENQRENNKKSFQNKNNYSLFKKSFKIRNKDNLNIIEVKSIEFNSNKKEAFSLDKKDFFNNENMLKINKKINLIEKKSIENYKNTVNEERQDNNDLFRLFKIGKTKKILYKNKEKAFPIIINSSPQKTDEYSIKSYSNNKNINILTPENKKIPNYFKGNIFNSLNKKKLQEKNKLNKFEKKYNKSNNNKTPIFIKRYNQNLSNNNNEMKNPTIIQSKNVRSLSNEKCVSKKYNNNKNFITPYNISRNQIKNFEEKINLIIGKTSNKKLKLKMVEPSDNNLYSYKDNYELKTCFKKINNPNNNNNNIINYKENNIQNNLNNNLINNKIDSIEEDDIFGDSFKNELNIIIGDVNNNKSDKKKELNLKSKLIDNYKNEKEESEEKNSIESCEDININLDNINDESEEKNIPKEQEEKINIIKRYTRPITSYGHPRK